MVGFDSIPRVSAVICHRGCGQVSGALVEIWTSTQRQGKRKRMMIVGFRDRETFFGFWKDCRLQNSANKPISTAYRLQDHGRFVPNGSGERVISIRRSLKVRFCIWFLSE